MPHDFLPGPDGTDSTSSGDSSVLPAWVLKLKPLATNPIKWLRKRLTFIIVGGVLELVTGVSHSLFQAFVAVAEAIGSIGASLVAAVATLGGAFVAVAATINQTVTTFATAFGPLAPAIVLASYVGIGYLSWIISVRLLRALLDAIPVLSGVETFIFG